MAGSPMGPKILLAKPGGEDDTVSQHRARLPWLGSLNLLSESLPWDFHFDRFLPFLTENTEFAVVGVIGPPGVGKSTIMNQLYGFDASSPGMLPPFTVQSDDFRATVRHSTVGIEPRVSSDRFILLDTQAVFSPSGLADMIRPDGSSVVSILGGGESLSPELAHEIVNIQVDLLKHGIPDPSQSPNLGHEKGGREHMAVPIFVHTKLRDEDLTAHTSDQLKEKLSRYFSTSSFPKEAHRNQGSERPLAIQSNNSESSVANLFVIPIDNKNDSTVLQYESCAYALCKLRDKVLSMNPPSFSRTTSERDWLKNSAKIWELVKSSSVISEYTKMLQSSGLFRR